MWYLQAPDGAVLMDFGNGDGMPRAIISDRHDDRTRMFSEREALQVAQLLSPHYGELKPVEEEFYWEFSFLSCRIHTLYHRAFPKAGTVHSSVHREQGMIKWEATNGDRIDEIYLSLDRGTVCIVPVDPALLFVCDSQVCWDGLDKVWIDRRTRQRLEEFAIDFWSMLQPYRESLKRLQERL